MPISLLKKLIKRGSQPNNRKNNSLPTSELKDQTMASRMGLCFNRETNLPEFGAVCWDSEQNEERSVNGDCRSIKDAESTITDGYGHTISLKRDSKDCQEDINAPPFFETHFSADKVGYGLLAALAPSHAFIGARFTEYNKSSKRFKRKYIRIGYGHNSSLPAIKMLVKAVPSYAQDDTTHRAHVGTSTRIDYDKFDKLAKEMPEYFKHNPNYYFPVCNCFKFARTMSKVVGVNAANDFKGTIAPGGAAANAIKRMNSGRSTDFIMEYGMEKDVTVERNNPITLNEQKRETILLTGDEFYNNCKKMYGFYYIYPEFLRLAEQVKKGIDMFNGVLQGGFPDIIDQKIGWIQGNLDKMFVKAKKGNLNLAMYIGRTIDMFNKIKDSSVSDSKTRELDIEPETEIEEIFTQYNNGSDTAYDKNALFDKAGSKLEEILYTNKVKNELVEVYERAKGIDEKKPDEKAVSGVINDIFSILTDSIRAQSENSSIRNLFAKQGKTSSLLDKASFLLDSLLYKMAFELIWHLDFDDANPLCLLLEETKRGKAVVGYQTFKNKYAECIETLKTSAERTL